MKTVVIDGEISLVNAIDGDVSINDLIDGEGITVVLAKNYDYYQGTYTITATEETQTIAVKDLMMSQNITIKPIPDNYGRITWDGTTLSIS